MAGVMAGVSIISRMNNNKYLNKMKMKKNFTVMAILAVTLIAGAQGTETDKSQQNVPAGGFAYVDANNNGICDNFEKGVPAGRFGRGYGRFYAQRGQGQPAAQVQAQLQKDSEGNVVPPQGFGPGQGYRWRNGAAWGPGQGYGRGMGPCGRGMGPGRGRNINFVDADKNGICDYFESVTNK